MIRSLLTLACFTALGGCAIVINPNDGSTHTVDVFGGTTQGNGQLTIEQRNSGFADTLNIRGPIQVTTQIGNTPMLEVEADGNLLPLVRTDVSDGVLRVWLEGNINTQHPVRLRYTTANLRAVNLSGSGALSVNNLQGGMLSITDSGAGSVSLQGKVGSLDAAISGSGSLDASQLDTRRLGVEITGSGSVALGQLSSDELSANVKGSGSLRAMGGNVRSANIRVSGSGSAHLSNINTEHAVLASYGSGSISLGVLRSVKADASGSGSINIFGGPIERSLSGKNIQFK